VSSDENNPLRQFQAAWEATTAVVAEWAEQTAAVTSEAFRKLTNDPAIRAVMERWRRPSGGGRWRPGWSAGRWRWRACW